VEPEFAIGRRCRLAAQEERFGNADHADHIVQVAPQTGTRSGLSRWPCRRLGHRIGCIEPFDAPACMSEVSMRSSR
jgi:hypothetical protein